MKKVFLRRILFLLGAAVAMAGCGKPESEIEPDGEDTPIKITAIASTSDTPETRLGYQENESSMSFTWKDHADGKKEAFSVYDSDYWDYTTFTQTDAGGGSKGTFEGTVKGERLFAFYPALPDTHIDEKMSLDLSTQTLVTNAADLDGNACHYLWASSVYEGKGKAVTFNFKHKVSILKVEMSFPAGAAAITAVKLRGVISQTTMWVSDGTLILIDPPAASILRGATDIALTADRKLTAYIYLFPDNLSRKTLRLSATDVNGKTYAVEFAGRKMVAGKLYTLAQELKEIVSADPQVGDFYLNDGTIISKDAILTGNQKAKCIGIVLKGGRDVAGDWIDTCHYVRKDGITPIPDIRGYVLALTDANISKTCKWGPVGTLVGTFPLDYYNAFRGYMETQIIKKYAIDNQHELQTTFPATYWAAIDYETQENGKYAAPANSSGWFLPSVGQCHYWLINRDVLLTSLREVIDNAAFQKEYWSGTEELGAQTMNVVYSLDIGRNDLGFRTSKDRDLCVRPIFAF